MNGSVNWKNTAVRKGKVSEWESREKKPSEGDRSLSSFQIDSKHSSTDSTAPFRKCNFSEILHLSSKRQSFCHSEKQRKLNLAKHKSVQAALFVKSNCVSGSSRRSNVIRRALNSLLSICHSGIAAKLFISCVLIVFLTSGHVILVLHWFCVCGPNVIWKRKYCSWTALRGQACVINQEKEKKCFRLQTTVTLESWTYQMCRNMVIKGQQLRWKCSSRVKQRWSGCFLHEDERLCLAIMPNISIFPWDISKNTFLSDLYLERTTDYL